MFWQNTVSIVELRNLELDQSTQNKQENTKWMNINGMGILPMI